MNKILWSPGEQRMQESLIWKFMRKYTPDLYTYQELHDWSVNNTMEFWSAFWEFSGLKFSKSYSKVLSNPIMPGAKWFEGAYLNYAENLLSGNAEQCAVISISEENPAYRLSFKTLNIQVAKAQQGLKQLGLKKGMRVAAFVPNSAETLILMLAVTATGAIWTSCSPDFGSSGVIDRFKQVEPDFFISINGYQYNGHRFLLVDKVNEILAQLPTVKHLIYFNFTEAKVHFEHSSVIQYSELLNNKGPEKPVFEQVPFDHPLFIMYSSGTTGLPKSIVHSTGGTLIQHLKEHQLQCDVRRGETTFFWFTTCGWMMWNWLVSALASGATLVLYDGSPGYPDLSRLWKMAEDTGITHFGTSPKFMTACEKAGVVPGEKADLSKIKSVFSTGSPLIPEHFDWVYAKLSKNIQLASVSGGTDILGCFLGGSPILPVYRGELQCVQLAMQVEAWDEEGNRLIGESGELVCTNPFPSMPIGFLNDKDNVRYKAAYFDQFPGVWTHGDFIEINDHGGAVIYGRSDTTLNPGGVRIGTSEIYRAVEQMDEILDAIVVGRPNKGDVEVVLCVKLREGVHLDTTLQKSIRKLIRQSTTPRHVPSYIFQVQDIPYTISGKKVEKAVLAMFTGRKIPNKDALANAPCLEEYAMLSFD